MNEVEPLIKKIEKRLYEELDKFLGKGSRKRINKA